MRERLAADLSCYSVPEPVAIVSTSTASLRLFVSEILCPFTLLFVTNYSNLLPNIRTVTVTVTFRCGVKMNCQTGVNTSYDEQHISMAALMPQSGLNNASKHSSSSIG